MMLKPFKVKSDDGKTFYADDAAPTPSTQAAGESDVKNLIDGLKSEQSHLAADRDRCDPEDELPRWDRLQRVIDHLAAPSLSASSVPVELPERVIDRLYQDAGVSSYHPDGDQQEALHAFARAVIVEAFARLPDAALTVSEGKFEWARKVYDVSESAPGELQRFWDYAAKCAAPPANPAPSVLTDEQRALAENIAMHCSEAHILAGNKVCSGLMQEAAKMIRALLQTNGVNHD